MSREIGSCAWSEERLTLLLYEGELEGPERERLLEHLEDCLGCREVQAALAATAASLDAVPLVRPSAAQRRALKERVLAAVAAPAAAVASDAFAGEGCPEEPRLLFEPDAPDLAAHLTSCAPCQGARREFAGVARAIELATPAPLAPAQREALRDRVLAAVETACPFEVELVDEPLAPEVAAHLAGCASCQAAQAELAEVRRALDQVPAAALTPAQRAALEEGLLQELGPGALGRRRKGRLVRLAPWVLRSAAAVLVASGLALAYATTRPAVDPRERLASLEHEADVFARSGRREYVPLALSRFRKLELRAQALGAAQEAEHARHEAEALTRLERALEREAHKGQVAPAVGDPGAVHPAQVFLAQHRDVLLEFPDTAAALFAIKRSFRHVGIVAYGELVFPNQRVGRFVKEQLLRRRNLLRHDYENLAKLVRPEVLVDRELRQAVLLQQGLHAEELWELTREEGLLNEARAHFAQAIELGEGSRAAELARAGLARLPAERG